MKTQFTAFALVAIVAAVGVFTLAVTSDSSVESSTLSVAGPALLGHVTYTVYDENGNIKAYSQSDNTNVNLELESFNGDDDNKPSEGTNQRNRRNYIRNVGGSSNKV